MVSQSKRSINAQIKTRDVRQLIWFQNITGHAAISDHESQRAKPAASSCAVSTSAEWVPAFSGGGGGGVGVSCAPKAPCCRRGLRSRRPPRQDSSSRLIVLTSAQKKKRWGPSCCCTRDGSLCLKHFDNLLGSRGLLANTSGKESSKCGDRTHETAMFLLRTPKTLHRFQSPLESCHLGCAGSGGIEGRFPFRQPCTTTCKKRLCSKQLLSCLKHF